MANNANSISTKITFEHWQGMEPDERDYFVFRSLQTIQTDVRSLKRRKYLYPVVAFAGGFAGGFTCIAAKLKFWG